jgi:hypothetical protein
MILKKILNAFIRLILHEYCIYLNDRKFVFINGGGGGKEKNEKIANTLLNCFEPGLHVI